MNRTTIAQKPKTASFLSPAKGVLQRKCACGNHAPAGKECSKCNKVGGAQLQQSITSNQPTNGFSRTTAGTQQSNSVETHADVSNRKGGPPPFTRSHLADTENRTGMPDNLKLGLEQLSGIDLSSVRVHYNSPQSARLDAFAHTQGTDIHLGPGQQKHLPHEGWHVVQQLEGRVKPTVQAKGMSINDNRGLEHEADVMGAKAFQLAGEAKIADFRTSLTGAAGLEDEPYVITTTAMAQENTRRPATPVIGRSNTPVIQRAANFVAGTVNATTNLATHIIAGRRDMGFTPPTLNGTTILSAATARGAINAPTLSGQSNVNGTVDTWVNTVPTNEASFTMQVPSSGPWSTTTTKANVATVFSSLGLTAQAGCSTAGNSTFSVNGKPSDAGFAANTRTHENLHVRDHTLGFLAVIFPWDILLQAAQLANTKFNGATVADAEAALYSAMGGTPDQVATRQHNLWISLNNATHAAGTTGATGGPATPSNSAANAACSTSSIDVT